jgi:hypothetical protein
MTVDNLVHQIKEGSEVPYDVLPNFVSYLQKITACLHLR